MEPRTDPKKESPPVTPVDEASSSKESGATDPSNWENGLIEVLKTLSTRLPRSVTVFAFILVLLVVAALGLGFRQQIVKGTGLGWFIVIALFLLFAMGMCLAAIVILVPILRKLREVESDRNVARQRLETEASNKTLVQRVEESRTGDLKRSPIIALWSRLVPRIELPEPVRKELSAAVERLRNDAYMALSELRGADRNTPPDCVRANLFLPDTRRASMGEVCGLFIPKGLHANMTNIRERELVFRTDEGLTGRVFVGESAEGAYRDESGEEWRRVVFHNRAPDPTHGPDYRLTKYQQDLIDKRLRWIISIPLKVVDGSKETTVGVMNVDCLDEEITSDEMRGLFVRLMNSVATFSGIIQKAQFDRVAIIVQKGKTNE